MTGISPIAWQQECALFHLRNDAKELLRLHKYHGDLTPDWLQHMKDSVALLQRIIDAHQTDVLRGLPEPLEGESKRPPRTLAVSDAS